MSEVSDQTDYVEDSPFPVPFQFAQNASNNVMMLYTNAKFYRTMFNTNHTVLVPLGNSYSPGLYYSTDTYFPAGIFNSTKPTTEVVFPNNNSVKINEALKIYHDIQVEFKLTKNIDGDGYQNVRKVQCLPVSASTPYDNSLVAYKQPGPNFRDTLHVQGEIDHGAGDEIYLRFNVMQDNKKNDESSTVLTIYRVVWNMCALKVI